ncbi:MAG: hypothetical protein IIB39_09850 [Candidatus Marinimicrobia bacterium]|nr:hypothetical protein [Candidatus Neomarinimicrobiota bacterium]
MEILYNLLIAVHVISFVFMSVPLFNLILVAERGKLGPEINYPVDIYMESILSGGSTRCFVYQATVGISGILLLVFGSFGLEALWTEWIISLKTLLLFTLIILLSRVHFKIQPAVDAIFEKLKPEDQISDDDMTELKSLRGFRKKLASFCLFLVLTIIILGLQVSTTYSPIFTGGLVLLAALFSKRVYSKGIPFGWV